MKVFSSIRALFKPVVLVPAVSAVLAAVSLGMPELQKVEGTVLKSYQDSVGVWTKCTGNTFDVQPNRTYTWEECSASDKERFTEFVTDVHDRSGIENPALLAAHSIFAYNIGVNGYDRSEVLRLTHAGQHEAGCLAMMNWHKAGGRDACVRRNGIYGLINHREHSINLCLEAIGKKPLERPFMCEMRGK